MNLRLASLRDRSVKKVWVVLGSLVLAGLAYAQGAAEAVLGYTDSLSAYVGATVGWTFQTTNLVTVTELGCFAKVFDDNPSVAVVQVGLWDNSGVLLSSNSITDTSRLLDQSRYEAVSPVALLPGQIYHIGVYYSGSRIGLDVAGSVAGGVVMMANAVQLRAAAASDSGFASPAEIAGTTGSLFAGPNFLFQLGPTLYIDLWTGGQVRLSWLAAYTGYTLQSRVGLSGSWSNAGLTVSTSGNRYVAYDSVGGSPKYYRLIK